MGNTILVWSIPCPAKDHPHIHGEYLVVTSVTVPSGGSPPHTWGIRLPGCRLICRGRITPTYMGNTSRRYNPRPVRQDHPHIHGEYRYILDIPANWIGSPPHTWGILLTIRFSRTPWRITPTYMGNTRLAAGSPTRSEDHPHIHGEYPT